jgi:hypothetical protein
MTEFELTIVGQTTAVQTPHAFPPCLIGPLHPVVRSGLPPLLINNHNHRNLSSGERGDVGTCEMSFRDDELMTCEMMNEHMYKIIIK